jgi:two-component system OmpR family response regulator
MKVLLIEDEERIADFIVTEFESAGFDFHHEADGFWGLNTALIKNFDAIILGVELPLIYGFQVPAEIQRKGLSTHILSGHSSRIPAQSLSGT